MTYLQEKQHQYMFLFICIFAKQRFTLVEIPIVELLDIPFFNNCSLANFSTVVSNENRDGFGLVNELIETVE
jgi:hypothetical protein